METLEIDVSALYLIAAPKTPPPVRTEALRRAQAGERITHADVHDVLDQYQKTGDEAQAVSSRMRKNE
jgi:hypothetical protein